MLTINGTFLFAAISFLVFLFIIKIILFQPITKVIEERNKFYAKNSKMENDSKEKSKALLDEKANTLQETRNKASNILKTANDEAKKESELKIEEAKKEVKEKIEKNQEKLNKEKTDTKNEIKNEVSNIVRTLSTKILGEEIEINLEEERINQYLNI